MKLITNLKGKKREYELGPKTLIVGPNGSGKSAIVDSLGLVLSGEAVTEGLGKSMQTLQSLMPHDADAIVIELMDEKNALAQWRASAGKRAVWDKLPGKAVNMIGEQTKAFLFGSTEKRALALIESLQARPKVSDGLLERASAFGIKDDYSFRGLKLAIEARTKEAKGTNAAVNVGPVEEFCAKHEIDQFSRPPGIVRLSPTKDALLYEIKQEIEGIQKFISGIEADLRAEEKRLPANRELIRMMRFLLNHMSSYRKLQQDGSLPAVKRQCMVCTEGNIEPAKMDERIQALAGKIGSAGREIEMACIALEQEINRRKEEHALLENWLEWVKAEEDWSSIAFGFNGEASPVSSSGAVCDVDGLKALKKDLEKEMVEYVRGACGVFTQRFKRNLPASMHGEISVAPEGEIQVHTGMHTLVELRALSGAERAMTIAALAETLANGHLYNVLVIDDVWFDQIQLKTFMNALKSAEDKDTNIDMIVLCAVELKGKAPKGWTVLDLYPEPTPGARKKKNARKETETEPETETEEFAWDSSPPENAYSDEDVPF